MAYTRLHTIINNYVIDVIDSNKNYAEYPITSWMSVIKSGVSSNSYGIDITARNYGQILQYF